MQGKIALWPSPFKSPPGEEINRESTVLERARRSRRSADERRQRAVTAQLEYCRKPLSVSADGANPSRVPAAIKTYEQCMRVRFASRGALALGSVRRAALRAEVSLIIEVMASAPEGR